MIRHCVLVNFRDDFGPEARATIYAGLDGLRAKLSGMGAVRASRNVSPEGLDKGFSEAFCIDFADAAVRDAYLVHPEHQALGARLVAGAAGGIAGVLVFDFDFGDGD